MYVPVCGSHKSLENNERELKISQQCQYDCKMCHAKYNQNQAAKSELGHGIYITWKDGLKFNISGVGEEVPFFETLSKAARVYK